MSKERKRMRRSRNRLLRSLRESGEEIPEDAKRDIEALRLIHQKRCQEKKDNDQLVGLIENIYFISMAVEVGAVGVLFQNSVSSSVQSFENLYQQTMEQTNGRGLEYRGELQPINYVFYKWTQRMIPDDYGDLWYQIKPKNGQAIGYRHPLPNEQGVGDIRLIWRDDPTHYNGGYVEEEKVKKMQKHKIR